MINIQGEKSVHLHFGLRDTCYFGKRQYFIPKRTRYYGTHICLCIGMKYTQASRDWLSASMMENGVVVVHRRLNLKPL